MDKKIIIVGAGPGGLVAGMLLAHRGFQVEVFEKNAEPGGRNGRIQLGDFKFDIGPTFFMMNFVLREIFEETGRNLDDYVKLKKLEPMYRLHFPDDRQMLISADHQKMKRELKRVFAGDEAGVDKFYKREGRRFDCLFPVLAHHNNNILEALHPRMLLALPHFGIGRVLYDIMGDYFKNEFAKLSFTFQSKYLGMSPWDCPGAFAMVPYIEHSTGVWHVEGGLSETARAMAEAIEESGGQIHYNSPVASLLIKNKKVYGVKLADGQEVLADKVVVNADFGYTMSNLVPAGTLRKWSPKKLAKKKLSCSIFMMYLGIDGATDLDHHTIVFARDYHRNVSDIFSGQLTDGDFSIYVRDATKTDPTLAPKGKTALYVLVPVPNNRSGLEWTKIKSKIRKQTLKILSERLGLKDLEQRIEIEKIITPADWESDYNVYEGAVFNLSHHLDQMLWFRPHNRFEELKNLYLTGGGTHPGSGLPTIYQSGKIVADLISKEFKVK
jgi:phytoene desaturase